MALKQSTPIYRWHARTVCFSLLCTTMMTSMIICGITYRYCKTRFVQGSQYHGS